MSDTKTMSMADFIYYCSETFVDEGLGDLPVVWHGDDHDATEPTYLAVTWEVGLPDEKGRVAPAAPLARLLVDRPYLFVEVAVAAYLPTVLDNTSEELGAVDAVRAVAFDEGEWVYYEILDVIRDLGLLPLEDHPTYDRVTFDFVNLARVKAQEKCRELFYARPWVDTTVDESEAGDYEADPATGRVPIINENGHRLCADCGLLTYRDGRVEDYRHCDPDAAECFLIATETQYAHNRRLIESEQAERQRDEEARRAECERGRLYWGWLLDLHGELIGEDR